MNAYDPFIGQTFEGRYTIVNVIGIGGMATVYGAYDQVTGRSVAIKMMSKKLEHNAKQISLFVNESTALSLLSHPNIVQVYNTAITNSTKYIIMEYVEGITLKKHIDHRGALPEREVLYYATQILSALDYIHSKGIVHCDIKPQNIILLQNGSIKVADFGIARLDAMLDHSGEKSDVALGTVYYVSPEQAQGKAPRAESDLYSLGAMLYEAMTNRLPFYHESATEVAKMQISREPTPPSVYRPDISVGLEQIILRAMEKNPKKRYSSATEMLTDIRALRQNSKTVFGNEKNSSRYKVIERKPHQNASNVSNRSIYPLNERGASFAENQAYFKRMTSHSGIMPRQETSGTGMGNAVYHTDKTRALTGRTREQTAGTRALTGGTPAQASAERRHSGTLPKGVPPEAPKASNTIMLNSEDIKGLKQSKYLSVALGVIAALILTVLLSFVVWYTILPSTGSSRGAWSCSASERGTEWSTEYTARY